MEEEKLRFLLQGVFGTVEGHAAFEAVLFERDEKSIDRFTRIAFSSETKKNVEEEGGGEGGGERQEGLLSARDRGYRCFDKRDSTLRRRWGRMGRKKKTRSVIIDDR